MKHGATLKRTTPLRAKHGFKKPHRATLKRSTSKPKSKKPTITKLKKLLWEECKRIIRARHGNSCYTCGRHGLEGSNWQTGHFISSSICSVFLRYHLDNLRPQCYNCNINKSGNWIAYEEHLIREHGRDFPELLKELNRTTTGLQYGTQWYEAKIEEYKQL